MNEKLTEQVRLHESLYGWIMTGRKSFKGKSKGGPYPRRSVGGVLISLTYEQPQNSPVSPPEQKSISPFSRMP